MANREEDEEPDPRAAYERALARLQRGRSLSSTNGNLGGLIAIAIVGLPAIVLHRLGYNIPMSVLLIVTCIALLAGKWWWRRWVSSSYERAEDTLRRAAEERGIGNLRE